MSTKNSENRCQSPPRQVTPPRHGSPPRYSSGNHLGQFPEPNTGFSSREGSAEKPNESKFNYGPAEIDKMIWRSNEKLPPFHNQSTLSNNLTQQRFDNHKKIFHTSQVSLSHFGQEEESGDMKRRKTRKNAPPPLLDQH